MGNPVLRTDVTLFDFRKGLGCAWRTINDTVMGGSSSSSFRHSESGRHAVFAGELSTAGGGGFASVRSVVQEFPKCSGYRGLEVFCEGDSRQYKLVLITNSSYDGVSYQQEFTPPPVPGTGNGTRMNSCKLPFENFMPTWRGRLVANTSPLDPDSIRQVGLMASKFGGGPNTGTMVPDFRPGPFQLRVQGIETY